MDKTSSEIFGHFIYDESLTYDELLKLEDFFRNEIQDLLERAEAQNIDFTPLGDSLMVQCSFDGHKVYIFRKIACDLAENLPGTISGKLVCISHSLDACHIYWLHSKKWEEQTFPIPHAAPEGLKMWTSHQEK
jgi:hypothetical protein